MKPCEKHRYAAKVTAALSGLPTRNSATYLGHEPSPLTLILVDGTFIWINLL